MNTHVVLTRMGWFSLVVGFVVFLSARTAFPSTFWASQIQYRWYVLSGISEGVITEDRYRPGPGDPSEAELTRIALRARVGLGQPLCTRLRLESGEFVLELSRRHWSHLAISSFEMIPTRALLAFYIAGCLTGLGVVLLVLSRLLPWRGETACR